MQANWERPGRDEVEFGPARSRRRRAIRPRRRRAVRRRPPVPLRAALAAVLLAVIAVVAVRSGLSRAPSRPAVSVTFTGRPVLGVRASWEVFAHGPRDLVAIDLARGKVTTTVLPAEVSGNPYTWFLVGPHEAIIRSEGGQEPGYVIPDGAPARPLGGTLAGDGPLLPGPVPGQAWRYSWVAGSPIMALVTLAGHPVGPVIALAPPHHPAPGMPAADGRGGVLLLESRAEAYDAGPDQRGQVNGQVIAVGPTRWLIVSCRDGVRCRNVVYDPRSGGQRELPGPALAGAAYIWPPAGVVSPDGSAAAIIDTTAEPATFCLINLTTGADTQVATASDQDAGNQSMAWSPDGRWLFVADDGRLLAVNARTGRVTGLGINLPDLSQVAVRPGPG